MTQTLSEFIKDRGDEYCARLFGKKLRTVAGWRRGERTPRPDDARLIVSKTGGEVSMAGIYAQPVRESN